MTAMLQAKIHTNFTDLMWNGSAAAQLPAQAMDQATFAAYIGCFQTMAIITVAVLPGILLFRVLRPDPGRRRDRQIKPVRRSPSAPFFRPGE